MKRCLMLMLLSLPPSLVLAQTPTCNPTAFVSIKGCKITPTNCPQSGVTACALCNPNDPTSRVVTTVVDQTNTGLQVKYTCPSSAQFSQIPASQLSGYTLTTCP